VVEGVLKGTEAPNNKVTTVTAVLWIIPVALITAFILNKSGKLKFLTFIGLFIL
jgi:hypothetical protein